MSLVRTRNHAGGTGRWSLWRAESHAEDPAQNDEARHDDAKPVEQWAWQLLRRWGVVFRDLLAREQGAPPWFELLRVYRRLEARGEIRGGRFVSGVAGEQFAVGQTVRTLRKLRDEQSTDELVIVSAADPLNLVGIVNDQPRIPSTASNRVVYWKGRPAAALISGEFSCLTDLPATVRSAVERQIMHSGTLPLSEQSAEEVADGGTLVDEADGRRSRRRPPRHPSGIPRPLIS